MYVYWHSEEMDDVSRIRDLSVGGLFLFTGRPRKEGTKVKMEFLVQEGQIRAEAVVRHWEASEGFGLKFTSIGDEDRHRLATLLSRLRTYRTETRKNSTVGRAG